MSNRLPVVGQDENTWGQILNDYLLVEHNSDGTLKNVARTADLAVKYEKPSGGIPESDLTNSVQIKLNDTGDTLGLNTQTGSIYSLVLSDAGKVITMQAASAQTLVVPSDAQVAFSIGTSIEVIRAGAGTVTISPSGSITTRTTAGGMTVTPQWGRVSLLKIGVNEWHIDGSLA